MLRFLELEKAALRKQAACVGLLYIIGIIAFQFVFKARMRHEDRNNLHYNEAILLFSSSRGTRSHKHQ